MKCNNCKSEMKPLFTSWYCSNGCDLESNIDKSSDITRVYYHRGLGYEEWDGRTCPDNGIRIGNSIPYYIFHNSPILSYLLFYDFSTKDIIEIKDSVTLIKAGALVLNSDNPDWKGL